MATLDAPLAAPSAECNGSAAASASAPAIALAAIAPAPFAPQGAGRLDVGLAPRHVRSGRQRVLQSPIMHQRVLPRPLKNQSKAGTGAGDQPLRRLPPSRSGG